MPLRSKRLAFLGGGGSHGAPTVLVEGLTIAGR
jgi:hypothetical protein